MTIPSTAATKAPRRSALAPPVVRLFSWPRALLAGAVIANLALVNWGGERPQDSAWLAADRFPPAVAMLQTPIVKRELRARVEAFVAQVDAQLRDAHQQRQAELAATYDTRKAPSHSAALEAVIAMLDSPGAAAFLHQHHAEGHRLRLELRAVKAALGEVALVELVFVASAETPVQLYAFANGWLEPRAESWLLREHLPRAAAGTAALLAVTGEVRVDAEREWLEANLELEVRADGQDTLAFGALAGWSDGSLQWVELSHDGAPCRLAQTPQHLLVQLPLPREGKVRSAGGAGTVRLRVRYRGRPGAHSQSYLLEGRGFFTDLVPRLGDDRPSQDVWVAFREQDPSPKASGSPQRAVAAEMRVPSLVSSLVPFGHPQGAPGTWRVAHLSSRAGDERELGFALAPFSLAGGIIAGDMLTTVYETPEARGEVYDKVKTQLEKAFRRLEPLGRLPVANLRLAVLHRKGTLQGQLVNGMIVLAPSALQTDDVLAHELAHLWFGHQVGNRPGEAARWSEAVAEYVSLWDLEPAWATQRRARRLREYEIVSREVALTGDALLTKRDSDALSYGKGELLFEALEVRLGKPAVVAFLRELAQRFSRKSIGWRELATLLGELHGAELGAWLQTWSERAGAPSLELVGRRQGNTFRGELVQLAGREHPEGAAYYPGVIEIFIDVAGQEKPEVHPIVLSGRRTPLAIALPAGALRVQLDPQLRFPRRRWITPVPENGGGGEAATGELLPERHVLTAVEL